MFVFKSLDQLAFLISIFVTSYVLMRMARKRPIKMASHPAIDSLPEIVGRATEMNAPLHSSGFAANSALGVAGLSILASLARMAARGDVRIFITERYQYNIPFERGVLETAYTAEGKEALLGEDNILWTGDRQYSHRCGLLGHIMTLKPAATLMFTGSTESVIAMEAGAYSGAVTWMASPGSTTAYGYLPIFLIGYDYIMIMDEVYAGAAQLSGEADQLGIIQSCDYLKILMIITILVGAVATALGWRGL